MDQGFLRRPTVWDTQSLDQLRRLWNSDQRGLVLQKLQEVHDMSSEKEAYEQSLPLFGQATRLLLPRKWTAEPQVREVNKFNIPVP